MRDINIEIKKILLGGLHSGNLPLTLSINTLLKELMLLYEATSSDKYINSAAQYILAYLQLGAGYLEHKSLFDKVLQKAGYTSEEISCFQLKNPSVPLNKARIRSLIGKWPASPHNSHTIVELVNDIIFRVENNNLGTYHYFASKKDGTYTALYQLSIFSDYALFHDVFRNRFYQLIKK